MPLIPGLGRADELFHASIGAAAAAVAFHSSAAARSSRALHDIFHTGGALTGRALLGASVAGGSALASAIVHLAVLESMVLGDRGPHRPSAEEIAASDAAVLAALKDRSIRSIPDVITVMGRIDAALPDGDGLKWFNELYRLVTADVGEHGEKDWDSPKWLDRLDLVFAELYFSGIEKCLSTPGGGPLAWRALLDVRRDHRIAPVQFALAGMSAHINRDLAVAVTRTWAAQSTAVRARATPEFNDYRKVDALLDKVEPKAIYVLCGSLVSTLDRVAGRGVDWTALQILHGARDLAWSHAEALDRQGPESDEALRYVDRLDVIAAGCAQAALVPVG